MSITQTEAKDIRRRIFACMETGNLQEAATEMDELKEIDADFHLVMQLDLAQSYGQLP